MRRASVLRHSIPLAVCLAFAALAALTGCGGGKSSAGNSELTFERLADPFRLSANSPIVEGFDAYRMPDRALRVRAHVRLPEDTRVQVTIKSGTDRAAFMMVQAYVRGGELLSPPMIPESGPLPVAKYEFELSAQFTAGWQSPEVLRATNNGKSLRGPGITRTRSGATIFWLVEEMKR